MLFAKGTESILRREIDNLKTQEALYSGLLKKLSAFREALEGYETELASMPACRQSVGTKIEALVDSIHADQAFDASELVSVEARDELREFAGYLKFTRDR
jgi:hypothetical protein